MEGLKTTSLFSQHQQLKAKIVSFSGWKVPLFYSSIFDEYKHCRQKAAIFDTSHMGEFIFEGDILKSGIEEAVTCPLNKMAVGKASYGFILNEGGGIIDDLIVLKLKKDKLLFVVNASARCIDFKILRKRIKKGNLKDISQDTIKIDLQGPLAKEVLNRLFPWARGLSYFNFSQNKCQGKKLLISRTGYTGELGYELFMPGCLGLFFWKELMRQKEVKPAGLGARDILRIEAGYNLRGAELDEKITPLEAGLAKFIYFSKDFIGKEALLQQKEQGVNKGKVAFSTGPKKIPRPQEKIYAGEKEIGRVTSGTFSFFLSEGIGLGYIEKKTNSEIEIGKSRQLKFKAEIKKLPFYKKGSLKN